MKVKLSVRKTNKGNTMPFVLEIYKGYFKNEAGKVRVKRESKTLDYYLYKVPKNPQQRQHNKEHKKLAEAVRSKTEFDLVNGSYGLKTPSQGKVSFLDYFKKQRDQRRKTKTNWDNWNGTYKYLEEYCQRHVTLNDVDVDFVKGFKRYLDENAFKTSGAPLSQNTKYSYFNKFRACIKQAFEDGLLNDNPVKRVKAFAMGEPQREYLTLDELKALSQTECRYDILKRAFLFSCLTGMRWSDINQLSWRMIRIRDDYWEVAFSQRKTKGVEYLPINDEAIKLLGEPKADEQKVFSGLKYSSYMNTAISQWVMRAGITKKITFHCARHTYATLQLTQGTDIYTVSKLLGHRELKTTQIYTKIVDEKKVSAMRNLPKLGL